MACKMKYKKGYKYQLHERYSFIVSWLTGYDIDQSYLSVRHGIVTAKAGYAWDGASGPTFDTKSTFRGSLIHDILYQLMRNRNLPQRLRKKADLELKKVCLEDGMWPIRAAYFYIGVSRFAECAAHPHSKREVLEAP